MSSPKRVLKPPGHECMTEQNVANVIHVIRAFLTRAYLYLQRLAEEAARPRALTGSHSP